MHLEGEFTPIDLSKYKEKTFSATITSKKSDLQNLVYCVNTESFYALMQALNEYKGYKEHRKLPKVGSRFIFYSKTREQYYRAYRSHIDNPVSAISRADLVDTGESFVASYGPERFYKLPPEFTDIPAQAIPCKINSFPRNFSSISDFIAKNIAMDIDDGKPAVMQLQVRYVMTSDNASDYLLVDALESSYKEKFIRFENDDPSILKLTVSNVHKFFFNGAKSDATKSFRYRDGPVMARDIPEKKSVPKANARVLVYPTMMIKPNLFYGQCRLISQHAQDNKDLTKLMINMNNCEKKHTKLVCKPQLNEMVIVADAERFYRGMVHEIFDDLLMILFVDYGWIKTMQMLQMYRFPEEFLDKPFQASRIRASNVKADAEIAAVCESIKPLGIGVVEECSGFDITVKLYSNQAMDVSKIIGEKSSV